jgi:hypothetical protein
VKQQAMYSTASSIGNADKKKRQQTVRLWAGNGLDGVMGRCVRAARDVGRRWSLHIRMRAKEAQYILILCNCVRECDIRCVRAKGFEVITSMGEPEAASLASCAYPQCGKCYCCPRGQAKRVALVCR